MAALLQSEYPILYLNSALRAGRVTSDSRLRDLTDRHTISLRAFALKTLPDPLKEITRPDVNGVVVWMTTGLPDVDQLRFAESVLSHRRQVWFYWPSESSIERLDRELIKSYMRHLLVAEAWKTMRPAARTLYALTMRFRRIATPVADDPVLKSCNSELDQLIAGTKPVPFEIESIPSSTAPLQGVGFYLRTDYWAPLTSGGSYGHTCYLARSLARTVEELICFTPSHYPLLASLGLKEIVLPPPGRYTAERDLLVANSHYESLLRRAIGIGKPAFIYERLCLGNYCGARLSQEFGIPYIAEYNGSEIEMSRLFTGHEFQYEQLLVKAEQAAFRQATAISVVSDALKVDLVSRGISPAKILVNPNGVDPADYMPPPTIARSAVRAEMGFDPSHTVVGFTGTFGGWHGIEVLAEALPQICKRNSQVRFLLVGDGSYKHLVDSAIKQYGLEDQVVCTGRVQQQEGARLLGACDIFVSPHSQTMSGGRFFGSPTKLFEYMAMGGGIVASDLDQIGEILSPALRARDLNGSSLAVKNARAVLCKPGEVSEFAKAVEYLVRNPQVAMALGQNARNAALADHTWDSHIRRLWRFVAPATASTTDLRSSEPDLSQSRKQPDERLIKNLRGILDSLVNDQGKLNSPDANGNIGKAYSREPGWWPRKSPASNHEKKKVLHVEPGTTPDVADNENSFDIVYCLGLSHVVRPGLLIQSVARVLKPGGHVYAIVGAENSYHHWVVQFWRMGLVSGLLTQFSMAELLSREIEVPAGSEEGKTSRVYTRERVRELFAPFQKLRIVRSGRLLFIRATK